MIKSQITPFDLFLVQIIQCLSYNLDMEVYSVEKSFSLVILYFVHVYIFFDSRFQNVLKNNYHIKKRDSQNDIICVMQK